MLKAEWEKLERELRTITTRYWINLPTVFAVLPTSRKDPRRRSGPKLLKALAESYDTFVKAACANFRWMPDFVCSFRKASEGFRTSGGFVRSNINLIHDAFGIPSGYSYSDDTLGGFTMHKLSKAWLETFYALHVAWRPDSLIVIPDSRYKLLDIAAIDPEFLRVISAREFEEFVAYLCELMGCAVELMQQTRDWGADILAWHGGPFKSKILTAIQVKRYAGYRKVTLKNIYELNGAVSHYNADLGQVVTTSTFTKPAMDFAKKQHINLVDMQKLHSELMRLVGK